MSPGIALQSCEPRIAAAEIFGIISKIIQPKSRLLAQWDNERGESRIVADTTLKPRIGKAGYAVATYAGNLADAGPSIGRGRCGNAAN